MTTIDLWKSDQQRIYNKTPLKIGLIGYSAQNFNEVMALTNIKKTFNAIRNKYGDQHCFILVSGLTNQGIPKLGYQEAVRRDWPTMGIACELAKDYDCFPVDQEIIFGKEWGDESNLFLNEIDILVRVGGDKQSLAEVAQAKEKGIPVIEFDL